ncbi:GTPase IMAP family member 8-like [Pomacea canaliculata]|uniref:GTPase IMAP family member 8-like n=1 Tax=Pomacea canaliculata TaxID=400727 RepID=UPI000D726DC8|nr:GTPase IMAP family member 8-like [Pomacea canaliculata]
MCPDPHLILLTIRCVPLDLGADVFRFRRFKRLCGTEFTRRRLVMLLTCEDKLKESVEDFKKRTHSGLEEIWREADTRHVFIGAREQETLLHQVFQICDELKNSKGDCMECEEESGSCDGFLDCALEANKQEETFMQNGHTKNVLKRELKVLIIGKTGNGKSSVGNSILNTDTFPVTRGLVSSAQTDLERTAQKFGVTIKVTDTPDVSNLRIDKEEANKRISKWKSCDPDVILLAIRCDLRYTAEEYQIYEQIKKVLGEEYVKQRLTVAFTFGDRQDMDIEEELKTICKELKAVLADAEGRYIVFSSQDKDEDKKRQLIHLMNLVPNFKFPSDLKRILLLGSTASGKISGGNALVRRNVFKAGTTMPKKTNYITEVDGMWLQVINTPELLPTRGFKKQMSSLLEASEPGPHAIVVFVRESQVASEDFSFFEGLEVYFGERLEHHLIVVTVTDERSSAGDDSLSKLDKIKCREKLCFVDTQTSNDKTEILTTNIKNLLQATEGDFLPIKRIPCDHHDTDTPTSHKKVKY